MAVLEFLTSPVMSWTLLIVGLCTLVMLATVIRRYDYLCISRWEWLVVGVGVLGVVVFEGLVILTGIISEAGPPIWLVASSRVMRLTMLLSIFWVLHLSARRQFLVTHEAETGCHSEHK